MLRPAITGSFEWARSATCPRRRRAPPDVRIPNPARTVALPGGTRSALTRSWRDLGSVRPVGRVVGLLCLPRHPAVLEVDLPAAGTRAVHTVRGADDRVVQPPSPVRVFPVTIAGKELAPPFPLGVPLRENGRTRGNWPGMGPPRSVPMSRTICTRQERFDTPERVSRCGRRARTNGGRVLPRWNLEAPAHVPGGPTADSTSSNS